MSAACYASAIGLMLAACGDASTVADASGDASDTAVADTHVTNDLGDSGTFDSGTSDTLTTDSALADTSVDIDEPLAQVVVNEVAPAGDPSDWLELYNVGESAVDLGGWTVRDADPEHGYLIPAGTTLAAGAFLVLTQGDDFDFGLGAADAVLVYDAHARLVDGVSWLEGDAPNNATWARLPDGSDTLATAWMPTPGAANQAGEPPEQGCGDQVLQAEGERCDGDDFGSFTCASWGWGGGVLTCADACQTIDQSACSARQPGLVINEVASSGDDPIELYNGGAASVDLGGYTVTDDAGNVYTLPATTLASGAYLTLRKGTHHDFGLGGDDAVTLATPDGAVVDLADWEEGEALVSYCRQPNGVGGFAPCAAASLDGPNPGHD